MLSGALGGTDARFINTAKHLRVKNRHLGNDLRNGLLVTRQLVYFCKAQNLCLAIPD